MMSLQEDSVTTENLFEARVRKEVYAEIIKLCEDRIRDIDSILETPSLVQPAAPPASSNLHTLLEELPWKEENPNFAWIFNTTAKGAQKAETQQVAEAIKKAGGRLLLGGFEYNISENGKFVQRKGSRTR